VGGKGRVTLQSARGGRCLGEQEGGSDNRLNRKRLRKVLKAIDITEMEMVISRGRKVRGGA